MWPSDSGPSPHELVGVFEIEVLNAIKGENTGQKKGEIFPQFFQIKAGNFITRATYFTQAVTRLMHLQQHLLKLSYVHPGLCLFCLDVQNTQSGLFS